MVGLQSSPCAQGVATTFNWMLFCIRREWQTELLPIVHEAECVGFLIKLFFSAHKMKIISLNAFLNSSTTSKCACTIRQN